MKEAVLLSNWYLIKRHRESRTNILYEKLRHLRAFERLKAVVMAGLSRKTMLGRITGREPRERVHASVAAAVISPSKRRTSGGYWGS